MANLVVIKNGEFYEAYDADAGITVFSATNQSVAQAFVNNGVVTPEVVRQYAQQDINYQGGIEDFAAPVNPAQNPQTPTLATDFIETSTGLNVLAEDVAVDPAGPTQEGLVQLNDG